MNKYISTVWSFLGETLVSFWQVLAEMSPWLLFGFLVAGILSVVIPTSMVRRHLSGKGFWAVVKASLFGIPLPLCSCGVIPVAVSLHKNGASRGATLSFLISTPQTGVDSIAVTYSLLGPMLAVYRAVIAFVTGVIGGVLGNLLRYDEAPSSTTEDAGAADSSCCSDDELEPCCGEPSSTEPAPKRGVLPAIMQMLRYGFIVLPKDIAKSLLIGLIIAGLITVLIPPDSLGSYLGGGILAMLLMVIISVPMYVCATASVPIAAAMVLAGVSYGGAFVFLVAGPATNAATVTTIARALGKRTATLYVGIVAVGAVLAGLLLDSFYKPTVALDFAHHMEMFPEWFTTACAYAMLAMIGYALLPNRTKKTPKDKAMSDESAEQIVLSIKGMSCDHCKNSVESVLLKQAGVMAVVVDLAAATALVTGENYKVAELLSAVNSAGFKAEAPA